jgi:creatinine amidohydrolase
MTELDWGRLTAPEIRAVAARGEALAVLPVGAMEQHGPHLPVFTDSRIAWELSMRAAALAAPSVPVLVLPAIWTGLSEHHLPFGGTISLDFAALAGVVRGVARSLTALGFARLLVVNGHGGNIDALGLICREIAVDFAMPAVAAWPWTMAPEAMAAILERQTGVHHACEAETSVMLALEPALVRTQLIEPAAAPLHGAVEFRPGLSRFWSFAERAPHTGVRGDPRPATAAKGEALLTAIAEVLASAMTDAALWRAPDAVWTAGRGLGATAPP